MGEALAMLPPTVADARTCVEPKRRMISAKSGASAPSSRAASARDARQPDHARCFDQRLREPQAGIRRTGYDECIRIAGEQIGEFGFGTRGGKERGVVARENRRAVLQRGQRGNARRRNFWLRRRAGLERCFDDRAVAGAAAEVSGELIAYGLPRDGARRFTMHRGEAHDDARRAEAAL